VGGGSLAQNSWSGVGYLLPRLLLAAMLAAVLVRPLAVLELDDASARSLGVSLKHLRLAGLGLAVFVTACVVSVVGLIGFIGLAPAMVRCWGQKTGPAAVGPILGALLLAATDLLLQTLSRFWPVLIPTGAMTALLGAPLLWLIRVLASSRCAKANSSLLVARHPAPTRLVGLMVLGLAAAVIASLLFGQGMGGWVGRAGCGGRSTGVALAAHAGCGCRRRVAGWHPVAASQQQPHGEPELLGVSGGTFMGVIAAALLLPALPLPMMLLGGWWAPSPACCCWCLSTGATASSRSGTAVWHRHHGAVRAVAGHRPGQRRPAGAATAPGCPAPPITSPSRWPPWWCWRC
jgi:iron complex transport system permease protein